MKPPTVTTSASTGVPSAVTTLLSKRATRPVSVISRCISNQSCSSSTIDGSDFALASLARNSSRSGKRDVVSELKTTLETSPAT